MKRRLSNRFFAALALALVLGGGAFAAVTAAQSSTHPSRSPVSTLGIAAAYLGVSEAQLHRDVRSGESLARVAQSTGRSTQGLIEAIVAARRSRLQAQLAHLHARVAEQVTHSRATGALLGRVRVPWRSPMSVAASYLGISVAQLHAKLLAGDTLAQVADATPGHSRAGLIAALLAGRRRRLDASVAAGVITPAQEHKWLARVEARLAARVDRVPQHRSRG
jgi:hypothetical protein